MADACGAVSEIETVTTYRKKLPMERIDIQASASAHIHPPETPIDDLQELARLKAMDRRRHGCKAVKKQTQGGGVC